MTGRHRMFVLVARGVGLTLAVMGALLVCSAGPRWTLVHAQDKTAQGGFKNLQVLKDVPSDQLIPAMNFMSASLGVQCEFCHVRDAFDKDDKQTKRTARRMIQMMFALDDNQFHGERAVTCFTCHRGSPKPVSIPLVDSTAPYVSEARVEGESAATGAADLPTADEVLQKYIQSAGGVTAIRNVSSRVESGTVAFGGGPGFRIQVISQAPSRRAMIIHLPAGDAATVFDGQSGWSRSASGSVSNMPAADSEGAKLDADLQLPIHLKTMFRKFTVVRRDKVDGHDAILLLCENSSAPPVELYFDVSTGLLLRQLRFRRSPLGLNPTQIDYSEYKAFDGVQVPLHMVITGPTRTMDIHLLQVIQNATVNDAEFARP